VAELLQEIRRVGILIGARSHPAGRRRALVARDRLGDLAQDALLVGLPQPFQVLGVGAAVRDDLVAAGADRRHDLRRIFVQQAVGVMRRGQLELVEQLEQRPHADAVGVVAPRIVAMRLRLALLRRVVAEAGAEREPLDVGRQHEREALAARPAVVLALDQRDEIVAAVLREKRLGHGAYPHKSMVRPDSTSMALYGKPGSAGAAPLAWKKSP